MIARAVLACAAAAVVLAGCSGGRSAGRALPDAAPPAQAQVRFSLTVPRVADDARRAQFIAPSVRSGAFSVNGGAPQVVDLTAGTPGCASTTSGVTCTFALLAPPGNDTFAVALYDAVAGTGAVLATGSTTASITAGAVNNVGITVGGIVASVTLSLATTTPVQGSPATIALSVSAADADGNTILGDPYALPIALDQLRCIGRDRALDDNGRATGQPVSLTYSGAALYNARLSATSGAGPIAVTAAVLTPRRQARPTGRRFNSTPSGAGYNPNESVCCTSAPPVPLWSTAVGNRFSPVSRSSPPTCSRRWSPAARTSIWCTPATTTVTWSHSTRPAVPSCGRRRWARRACRPVTTFPDGSFGITSTMLLDRARSRLYVVDGSGLLWAFDPATGAVAGGWPAGGVPVVIDPALDHVWGALNLDAGRQLLYVPTASYCGAGDDRGSVRAVDVVAARVATVFFYGLPSSQFGGGSWGYGGVTIDPASGDVFAATANLRPNESAVYSDSILRWTPQLANVVAVYHPPILVPDDDFGASPTLFPDPAGNGCLAVQRKDGVLHVLNRAVGPFNSGATQTIALGFATGIGVGTSPRRRTRPVTRMLYVGNGSDRGDGLSPHGVYGFNVQSGCTLAQAWYQPMGGENQFSMGVIANGTVTFGHEHQLAAFDARSGTPLWQIADVGGAILATPTVVDGTIFVPAWDGKIHAYAAPAVAAAARARRASRR